MPVSGGPAPVRPVAAVERFPVPPVDRDRQGPGRADGPAPVVTAGKESPAPGPSPAETAGSARPGLPAPPIASAGSRPSAGNGAPVSSRASSRIRSRRIRSARRGVAFRRPRWGQGAGANNGTPYHRPAFGSLDGSASEFGPGRDRRGSHADGEQTARNARSSHPDGARHFIRASVSIGNENVPQSSSENVPLRRGARRGDGSRAFDLLGVSPLAAAGTGTSEMARTPRTNNGSVAASLRNFGHTLRPRRALHEILPPSFRRPASERHLFVARGREILFVYRQRLARLLGRAGRCPGPGPTARPGSSDATGTGTGPPTGSRRRSPPISGWARRPNAAESDTGRYRAVVPSEDRSNDESPRSRSPYRARHGLTPVDRRSYDRPAPGTRDPLSSRTGRDTGSDGERDRAPAYCRRPGRPSETGGRGGGGGRRCPSAVRRRRFRRRGIRRGRATGRPGDGAFRRRGIRARGSGRRRSGSRRGEGARSGAPGTGAGR